MVDWQLGLQLVHILWSLAASCGPSPLVTSGHFLTWSSSWIYASVGMASWPWWTPIIPVSTTWSFGDCLGEDLGSILHLVTRISSIVNAAAVALVDLICILRFHAAFGPRRTRQDELAIELDDEREFTDKWARDCPKNYQVWYHRRWLISEIAARKRSSGGASAEEEILQMAREELGYHLECMQVNNDYKNYNGWSHRQFILQQFNLWKEELPFVEQLLSEDIRNNSAWNHRYAVVRNESSPLSDAVRDREIKFAMDAIRNLLGDGAAKPSRNGDK
eukprot:Skav215331  [mRNA]  locus=scaffold1391:33066:38598:- [translate_table: standard]